MMQKKIAEEVIKLALADTDFRSKLKNEPIDTLKSQGLSPELAEDVAREINLDGIQLASSCSYTCAWTGITLA
ncbi:MAG: hypothetical protein OIF40_09900 [Mangrovicoccus sp.]|nr:hypothetical protein [Mangrovicoccus sp.]